MQESERNLKTLWNMMAGHRRQYLFALVAMFGGVGMLYLTPLITRAAIDGGIDVKPSANLSALANYLAGYRRQWGAPWTLSLVAVAMICVTCLSSVLNYLQGRWSGIASETIARQLRDRLA